jgi:hypothetical protein
LRLDAAASAKKLTELEDAIGYYKSITASATRTDKQKQDA